jgi:hypothetical protein
LSETDPSLSRLAQQEIWRKRLGAAESAYQHASEEHRLTLLRMNGLVTQEPAPEIVNARARKDDARMEYLRVLRVFSDIVLRGKSPDAKA